MANASIMPQLANNRAPAARVGEYEGADHRPHRADACAFAELSVSSRWRGTARGRDRQFVIASKLLSLDQ